MENGSRKEAIAPAATTTATSNSTSASSAYRIPKCCGAFFFEYETPKVVSIQNVPLGILRVVLQLLVIAFVVVFQLWYSQGYQEFAEVESSVTTKVKGFARSMLTEEARARIPPSWHDMYERVWDEADYVVPPAENGAFFVMTNVVITPNQTRSVCPEDPDEVRDLVCNVTTSEPCREGVPASLIKGHGVMTGKCVPSDRSEKHVCEITSWCPVEKDKLPLGKHEGPLIPGFENYTVFLKNSISFPRFGDQYTRKNMRHKGYCMYKHDDDDARLCPIFRLGDIVRHANGNITKLATKGGVIGIEITWNCDLDWNFMKNCLPSYNFRILDDYGWNFRHAFYHEENRRTLIKAYGLKFLLLVDGRAGKFDLKNTVIVIVTGLGLLGLSTMFCDFVLLNYSPERKKVKEKKYETVETTSKMLESTMRLLASTSMGLQRATSRRDLTSVATGTQTNLSRSRSSPRLPIASPRKQERTASRSSSSFLSRRSPAKGNRSTSGGSDELTPLTTVHNSNNATTANNAAATLSAAGSSTWLTAENANSVVVGSEI